jgi:aldose sugar dehydrogenase
MMSPGFENLAHSEDIIVKDPDLKVELVAEGLRSPTSMAFLGPDDILVLEKEGKVQRIMGNDILENPVLDITNKVNSSFERGLLGIAIRANEQADDDFKSDTSIRNIYLYYTENVTNKENANADCLLDQCKTIDNIANRLYRFEFEDSKLVNPKLLLNIPLNDNSDFIHVGGIITVGPDNHLFLSTGDGKTCGYYEECRIITMENGPLDSQTANIKEGTNASGRGGILHFEDDGKKVAYPYGILGENYPLNLYYAYGIRNSFGIDLDHITGNLWDTENGPAFGDEINLVEPGFNSGWAKVQGMWPITNHSQLANDAPPGIEKGYFIPKDKTDSYKDDIFDFDSKGKYSEPEFTWNHTVGVTSIKFLDSDKYGPNYKDDLFVGTFNGGFIYHFDLTKDRKELLLKEELLDKVANDDEELSQVVLARGFGGITDLEVSPDGYLYVISTTEGKIWRFVT